MTSSTTRPGIDATRWVRVLTRYGAPDHARSVLELLATAVPYLGLWALMLLAYQRFGVLASLPLALPAAGFLIRLFVIQHDCGHGSFFRSSAANRWVGMLCSLVTLTPYENWRRQHAGHHMHWNDLDNRNSGSVSRSG